MAVEHRCDSCSGCTARHTDEHVPEEVSAVPYLLFSVDRKEKIVYALDNIWPIGYIINMKWDIEFTDEFGE